MSGIYGIFKRDGSPVEPLTFETMRRAMAEWGPDGGDSWLDGCLGLGQARMFSTPEAHYERFPCVDPSSGLLFASAARLDNRDELLVECGLSQSDALTIGDGELLRQTYLRWGEDCVKWIYGDWSFAAYHPSERKLFLARDHFGNTSIYYYTDFRTFVFASSRKAILALNLAPKEMDELFLAQVLMAWPAYHGEQTVHKSIKRLPPAHCLTVTPERLDNCCFWRMEETSELRLPRHSDYVEAFKGVFEKAVKARFRTSEKSKERQIAVTLSGGLDSGLVAAVAARLLHSEGKRLKAFTSAPLFDGNVYVGPQRFADELPFARATALQAGNIDLYPFNSESISPIQSIRKKLEIENEPSHGAGNSFWIQALMENVRDSGCSILLTGQNGNAGISWTGDVFSQSLAYQLRYFGGKRWLKEAVKRCAPSAFLRVYRKMFMAKNESWQFSAIHPDFARRLNLLEQMLESSNSSFAKKGTSLEQRFSILMPGCSNGGAMWAESAMAYGLEVRDPTADVRVLAFTLSVPDHVFIDPRTGLHRWLIREAMKGYVPDEVRLNRKRGRQAADLIPRLRRFASDVEAALDELSQGPSAAYVDVNYMGQVWQMVQTQDTPDAFHKSLTVLMRGILAGLFVNGIAKS
ncbi:MAG: asparagine synthetase B [Candidatus Riflebacteria bacterium]|nr:asparagine synthetase B [Candidatus Riflebacteria bacterium]